MVNAITAVVSNRRTANANRYNIMTLCHQPFDLRERPSHRKGMRLFVCNRCGRKWAYTEAAGYYYQQGRPLNGERKAVVMSVRATSEQAGEIRAGRARFVYRHNEEKHE